MKRILALILVIVLSICMFGCTPNKSDSDGNSGKSNGSYRCNNCGGDGYDGGSRCEWCGGDGKTSWNP